MKISSRQIALLAGAVYLLSFLLPVFKTETTFYGFEAFAFGWNPPYTPFWFANVAFVYSVFKLAHNDARKARKAGLIATVLAILYIPASMLFGDWGKPLQIGYYMWVASMVIVAIGGWVLGNR
jgi:hypothetical protein